MEELCMLLTVIQQDWVLAKVDLKDAYLTILVAQEFHQLLAFQVKPGKWTQFKCLPFGFCTASFIFTKVTKLVTQFLPQQGIYIILYLNNLLIAAPNVLALQQDQQLRDCPINTLRTYITKMADLIEALESPKPLFITSRKPSRRAKPGTLGHWIKDTLKQVGIATDHFLAHSTRSSGTSHAHAKGVPINEILKVGSFCAVKLKVLGLKAYWYKGSAFHQIPQSYLS